jgi:hypothetical protein
VDRHRQSDHRPVQSSRLRPSTATTPESMRSSMARSL